MLKIVELLNWLEFKNNKHSNNRKQNPYYKAIQKRLDFNLFHGVKVLLHLKYGYKSFSLPQ